jgi:hypothetical protein
MRFRSGALLILVLLLATATFARINTGIISGKVADPSGALVPGAQITVTQLKGQLRARLHEPVQAAQLEHRSDVDGPEKPARFGTVSGPTDFNDSVEGGQPQMLLSFRVRC